MKSKIHVLIAIACLLCLVGLTVNAKKLSASKITWEYKVVTGPDADKQLSEFGAQGWELVAVESQNFKSTDNGIYSWPKLYFKRTK